MQRDYIGYVLAVISIVIAVWVSWFFYDKSIQRREPVFLADYVPSTVYDVDQKVQVPLKVLRENGEPLSKSVHVATHILVNRGNAPISSSDILTPIRVSLTEKDGELLSVAVARQSRSVVSCSVKQDTPTSFAISFRILEQNDGCQIRVFYAGSRSPKYAVKGEIVGVKNIAIRGETFYEVIDNESPWKDRVVFGFQLAARLVPFVMFSFLVYQHYMRGKPAWRNVVFAVLSIMLVGLIGPLADFVRRERLTYASPVSVNTEDWVASVPN